MQSVNASVTTPYNVTVTATDGTDPARTTFAWNISNFTLDNPGDQTNAEGDAVALQSTVETNGTPTLTFSANGLPNGLSINPSTGLIAGTVANFDANSSPYNVTISASDDVSTSSQTFTWTVTHVLLIDPADQINAPDDRMSLQVQASDPDGDTLTYGIAGLPPGLSINSATGLISGLIASTAGSDTPYNVTVTASDGSHTASDTFSWTVINGSVEVANPGTQNNAEGDNVSLQINASDPAGNPLSYTAFGLPLGLQIDPNSGLISGTIDGNAAETNGGVYQVTVLADDGLGHNGSATFTWNVTHINQAPMLDNPGDQVNQAGAVVSLPLNGYDGDGDKLTYSATRLPAGLSVDPSSGIISGTLAMLAGSGTPYAVTVTVSDGSLTASQSFNWFVTSGSLTLANPGDQINTEGDSVSVQLSATGNSSSIYQVSGLPSGLALNRNTGLISGTVAAGDAAIGQYLVTISAADTQGNSSAQQFNWYISAPAHALTLANPGPQSNTAGTSIALQIQANDPDGDTLTYAASGLPLGLTIDAGTGLISGTIAYSAAYMAGGHYSVTVMVEDGNGDYKSQVFSWTVSYTGQGPWLDNPGDQDNYVGDAASLQLVAGSPSDKPLTYSVSGLPAGLSVDAATGRIAGTITAAVGDYTVTAGVTDGMEEAEETFTWEVSAAINPNDKKGSLLLKAISGSDSPGGKNGVFAWPIQWQVTGNSDSGVILQLIDVQSAVKLQLGATKDAQAPKRLDPSFTPYAFQNLFTHKWYEAWIVTRQADGKNVITPKGAPTDDLKALKEAGVKLPTDATIGDMNDWFYQTNPGRFRNPGRAPRTTYGSETFTATAIFYEGMTVKDLENMTFKKGGNTKTGSGNLLSYRMGNKTNIDAMAKFLAKYKTQSEAVSRTLTASWDPAKDDGKTKVETTVKP